jgi:hypothetical protein
VATVRIVGYGDERSGPPADVVHAVHERYLLEVVEELGLCPFARHSRETGRVHRPVLWLDDHGPTAEDAAAVLLRCSGWDPAPEIVLLTFVDLDGRFARPDVFDAFVAEVREAYAGLDGPRWFMVGFHPDLGRPSERDPERPLTKDSLVPRIRRTPDPVIQCVHGDTLDGARSHAQQSAQRRLLESLGDSDPVLRALLERSVQADSQLSADIAHANFAAVGAGPGLATLERTLADIRRERDASYAPYVRPPGSQHRIDRGVP